MPETRLSYRCRVANPRKPTVLQVVPELETGGAEQTTVDVARALVQSGGKAIVASRGGRMTDRLSADGALFFAMPAQSKNPLTLLRNSQHLTRLIKEYKVDLIHARSRAPAFSALWAARRTGIPFVATYHGVYKAGNPLKRWYNAVMTRGDMVIANSDYTRDHLFAEHGTSPDKVVTIPRGVDLSRFDPALVAPERIRNLQDAWGLSPGDSRTRILLGGRLTRIKGHLTVIEAAARMKAAGRRDFIILFAGDDQGRSGYRQELEAAISRADLVDEVRLVGHCTDMPAAFLLADLAILPTAVPESFGRAAVEPQAMGRPVIASAHGGVTETVVEGGTGWLVPPEDPSAWTKALTLALDMGRDALREMGQTGIDRVRQLYSNETMCAATLAAYDHLLSGRGS